MKKAKYTKLFVLVLSLALLIGSVVGIAASADEDTVYEIESINIAHEDAIKVLIAVDAPIVADSAEGLTDPGITVNYTMGGKTYAATFWCYMNIRKDNNYYPIYFTRGIAAKDGGEAILAEAHKGATPAAPAYRSISVADYLYGRLFNENYISKTESDGKDNDRKLLYIDLLEYIAAAQKVLWNDKIDENGMIGDVPCEPRELVTERSYFGIRDGYAKKYVATETASYTYETFATGQYDGEATLKLVYTGKNPLFKGWNITKFVDGEIETSYVDSYRYVLDGGCVAIAPAFYTEAEATALHLVTYDEANVTVGDGWYVLFNDLDGNGKGGTGETELIKSANLPERLLPAISGTIYTVGNKAVVENDDVNPSNYIRYKTNFKTDVTDKVNGSYLDSKNMSLYLQTDQSSATGGATKSTVAFDMKLNFVNGDEFVVADQDFAPIYIHAAGNTLGSSGLTLHFGTTQAKEFYVKVNGTKHVAYNAQVNEWFRLKVELVCNADKTVRVLNFYADDVLIVSIDVKATGNTGNGFIKDLQFSPSGNIKYDISIDRFTYTHEYQ